MMDIKAVVARKPVLVISFVLAVASFAIAPNLDAFGNIRPGVLCILFIFMGSMSGLKACGVFESIAENLTRRTDSARTLAATLVAIPYFVSMFITNDVALLVFVPLSLSILLTLNLDRLIIPVLALQTLSVNIGCMLTPFGNPHNLYIFTEYGLSFGDVVSAVLPYVAVGTVFIIAMLLLIEDGKLETRPGYRREEYSRLHLWVSVTVFAIGVVTVFGIVPYWAAAAVAVVLIAIVSPRDLLDVNYGLILTFVCLFIFTGNISHWDAFADALSDILSFDPLFVTAMVSQVTSNLPATVLLDGFTDDWYGLLVGSDIGGYGSPIASMASLITLEAYSTAMPGTSRRYLKVFLAMSVSMLAILLLTHAVVDII